MDGLSKSYIFETKTDSGNATCEGARSMGGENTLQEKARNLILAGIVPHRPPDRMWGGAGVGVQCIVCDRPVKRDQTGLELEYTDGAGAAEVNHHAHVPCYSALEA